MVPDGGAPGITRVPAQYRCSGTCRAVFRDLSLGRKVALIPALTLLLMGLMLAVAVRTGERNTAALSALDRDVFEPLNRAQTMKDGITQLHTRLFALLSLGTNQSDPAAQKAAADVLIAQLDEEVARFARLLDATGAVPPAIAARLRAEFATYAVGVRETAGFAAYDASYGALLAGGTDDHFVILRTDLTDLVRALAQRRELAHEGSHCRQRQCAAPVARPWPWRRCARAARLSSGRAQHFPAGAPTDSVDERARRRQHRSRGPGGQTAR